MNLKILIKQVCVSNVSRRVLESQFLKMYKLFNSLCSWLSLQFVSTSFSDSLDDFLLSHPQFRKDIFFAEDNTTILSSRFYCYMNGTSRSVIRRKALESFRKDLKNKLSIPIFASSYQFIYIEQFIAIQSETTRSLVIAAIAITIATSFFLVNPLVILLVLIGFVSLIFELLGKN